MHQWSSAATVQTAATIKPG